MNEKRVDAVNILKKLILIFPILLLLGQVQAADMENRDTVSVATVGDTIITVEKVVKKPHSPHKATLMAMALPGSGQIYNGQWWKVPVLYGGIAADLYGIIWNNKRFREYKDAFVEYSQYLEDKVKDPNTPYPENPAWDNIPKGFDVETDPYLQTSAGQQWFKNTLSNRKTSFKRNRDLCFIVMAAIYAINIIDATVYAHFYDFEIDEDLSFNLRPTSNYSPLTGGSIGLCLTINF